MTAALARKIRIGILGASGYTGAEAVRLLARHPNAEIVIDNGEIHEYQWLRPEQALVLHAEGELALMPPAFLTLSLLSHYQTVDFAK